MGISIADAIKLIMAAPPSRFTVLVGPPGYGKSAAWQEAAKQMDALYWPIYGATLEAVEVNGLPRLVERDGRMYGEWAPFPLFPLKGESYPRRIVINIDDLGQCTHSVQKAIVRCVYGDGSKRLMGQHELYPDVIIGGTSNLHAHRAGSHRFETYVVNRATLVEIEPGFVEVGGAQVPEWCFWANAHGVDPIVVGFVAWTKTVTDFAPDKDAFMSPRSLEALSDYIGALGKAGIDGAILRSVAFGTIGEQAGSQFLAYHALAKDLPDMDKVLAGDKGVKLPARPEVQYMFVSTLTRTAKEQHVPVVADLIVRLTEVGSTGFEVAAFLAFECVKGSAAQLRGIRSQPALYKWLAKNGKYLPALLIGALPVLHGAIGTLCRAFGF